MDEAYENSYKLLMGETTYDELGKDGPFLLPKNHEDPLVTLEYFIDIEDYEKCSKIRNKILRPAVGTAFEPPFWGKFSSTIETFKT